MLEMKLEVASSLWQALSTLPKLTSLRMGADLKFHPDDHHVVEGQFVFFFDNLTLLTNLR